MALSQFRFLGCTQGVSVGFYGEIKRGREGGGEEGRLRSARDEPGTRIMCGKTDLSGVRVGEVSTSVSVFILRFFFSRPSLFLQSPSRVSTDAAKRRMKTETARRWTKAMIGK